MKYPHNNLNRSYRNTTQLTQRARKRESVKKTCMTTTSENSYSSFQNWDAWQVAVVRSQVHELKWRTSSLRCLGYKELQIQLLSLSEPLYPEDNDPLAVPQETKHQQQERLQPMTQIIWQGIILWVTTGSKVRQKFGSFQMAGKNYYQTGREN